MCEHQPLYHPFTVEFISTIAEAPYDKSRIFHFLIVFILAAVIIKKQIQIIKKICITVKPSFDND